MSVNRGAQFEEPLSAFKGCTAGMTTGLTSLQNGLPPGTDADKQWKQIIRMDEQNAEVQQKVSLHVDLGDESCQDFGIGYMFRGVCSFVAAAKAEWDHVGWQARSPS